MTNTKWTIESIAKISGTIAIDADSYYGEIEYLDIDPDEADNNWTLLDVKAQGYGVEKLYRVQHCDYSFVVMFCYDTKNLGEKTLFFPSRFDDSDNVKTFADLDNHTLDWIPSEEFEAAFGEPKPF